MKIQPRLILTSFCTLLATVAIAEAQAPQPRFGYGSVPRGSYVIPAPKAAKATAPTKAKPKPVVASTAKPKPKVDQPVVKPKAVAAAKSPAKPNSAKTTARATPAKPIPGKAAKREVASGKSKATQEKSVKPVIARNNPPARSNNRTPAIAPKPAAKPVQTARVVPANSRPTTLSSKVPTSPANRGEVAGHDGPATPNGGFHFFGSPIALPQIPTQTSTTSSASRNTFVDLMAARHSLGDSHQPFKPRLPQPKPVVAQAVPTMTAKVSKPAPQPFVERIAPNPESDPPQIPFSTPDTKNLQPVPPVPPVSMASTDLLDDPILARSTPVSLSLSAVSSSAEIIPDTTVLDEPALPSPVISSVEKPKPSLQKTKPDSQPEPPLPVETSVAASLPAAIENAAGPHDLSERERDFVRSLAEAAGSVTSASGRINQDLPASITTAATAVLDQIPAETVSTFRSLARTSRHVKSAAKELVPDLPMEISNDLMPATPDKMPDQLPTFNAASSGKIDVQSDRQADYDQANNKVIFTGKVELNSAAIRLRAERVEVFMKKGGGGMERVEASGNVLMRTQDTESGPGQMASSGRASYNLKTGEITLSDWPKIQEAGKSHISTDPSTKMYMFTDGRLRTDGPNRTLIGGE